VELLSELLGGELGTNASAVMYFEGDELVFEIKVEERLPRDFQNTCTLTASRRCL
jgi:hypothetical protein